MFVTQFQAQTNTFPKDLIQLSVCFLLLFCCDPSTLHATTALLVLMILHVKLFYIRLKARACVRREREGSITFQILNQFFVHI